MLIELAVENLVIVRRAVLGFNSGLSVITGETGAGKSLLLDALDLVAGARAKPGLIGRWGDAATVTAVFQLSPPLAERLVTLGFPQVNPEEGQVILRRRVQDGGRSQAWMNDVPVTLQSLRSAADLLVDIHAQHEPIRLADPRVQLELLDAYGGHAAVAAEFRSVHDRAQAMGRQLEELRSGGQQSLKELDYVRFQLREIEAVTPRRGEYAELEARFTELQSVEEELRLATQVLDGLREGDAPVISQLQRWVRRLESGHAKAMRESAAAITAAAESLDDAARVLSRFVEAPMAQGDLAQIGGRLDELNGLLRKHGPDEEALFAAWDGLVRRSEDLANLDRRVEDLQRDLAALDVLRGEIGARLADLRRKAFGRLAKEVHRHLADLGMPKAAIRLHEDGEGANALGTVRQSIEVCTNPGQPFGSIRDVASGGEAARLMLAISAALAAADGIPVIVYDEVDSGVGGRLGAVIGAKLAHLAQGRTVIAVTHTPQLAASGSGHFRVRKDQGKAETSVSVEELTGDSRLEEIADMLGGGEPALAQARSLMQVANGPARGPR